MNRAWLLFGFWLLASMAFAQGEKRMLQEAEGDTLLSRQEYEEAFRVFDRLVKAGFKQPSDYRALYKRAFCEYTLSKPDDALRDLESYIQNVPDQPAGHILRSFVYKSIGDLDHQLDDLHAAIRIAGPRVDLLKWRAEAYIEAKNYAGAKNDLILARGQADDEELELSLGIAYFNLDDVDSAFICLNDAIVMNPTELPPYIYAATFCLEKDNAELAIKYLDVALRIDPHQMDALFYKGAALVESGKIDEGCKCLTTAFQNGVDEAGDYLVQFCYGSGDK